MSGLKGHDAAGKVEGIPCQRFKLTNNIFGFGRYGVGIDGGRNTFCVKPLRDYLLALGSGDGCGKQRRLSRWSWLCPQPTGGRIPRWRASAALSARLTSEPCHTEQGHARQAAGQAIRLSFLPCHRQRETAD